MNLPITLALSLSFAVSVAASIYNTVIVNGFDSGWDASSGSVSTSRSVAIDSDLEVRRDLTIGGSGSYLELGGVDCASETPAPGGSGRLCFDRQAAEFRVSQNRGDYVSLRGRPAGATPFIAGVATMDDPDGTGPQRPSATIPLPPEFIDALNSGRLDIQLTPIAELRRLFFNQQSEFSIAPVNDPAKRSLLTQIIVAVPLQESPELDVDARPEGVFVSSPSNRVLLFHYVFQVKEG